MVITLGHFVTMLCVSLIMLMTVHVYSGGDSYSTRIFNFITGSRTDGQTNCNEHYFTLAKVINQRNNISRELNDRQKKLGQIECQHMTKSNQTKKVSSSGGWCAERSVEEGHMTDRKIVPALARLFKGKTVASFGDGPGRYKQLLLDTGLLKGYDAYDGAPFSEKTSEGRVQYLDLTLPQYGLPLYDWVMSLEVAEHIPKEYEHVYLDNIARHAKEGVVLSWAKPGQKGYSHVNNQPFSYVKAEMYKLGFVYDLVNSTRLKEAAKFDWLKSNTNVYWRKNTDDMKIHELQTFWT